MTDNGGTTQTVYTHGLDIDEPLALERSNQYAYYHADGLGSLVSITDGTGNIIQTYTMIPSAILRQRRPSPTALPTLVGNMTKRRAFTSSAYNIADALSPPWLAGPLLSQPSSSDQVVIKRC